MTWQCNRDEETKTSSEMRPGAGPQHVVVLREAHQASMEAGVQLRCVKAWNEHEGLVVVMWVV